MLGAAKLLGALARAIGQPSVFAELAADVRLGPSVLGLVDPVFFVSVGAAVNVRVFNLTDPANRPTLVLGGLLLAEATVSKFTAGHTAPWFEGRKSVIGVGMIPRGEVGLIFAQMGLATGVFDAKLSGAVTLMVMVTTFLAPPLLRALFLPADASGFHPRCMASTNGSGPSSHAQQGRPPGGRSAPGTVRREDCPSRRRCSQSLEADKHGS